MLVVTNPVLAAMTNTYGFYFGQPWWLLAGVLVVPVVWLARRNLTALGRLRQVSAIILRVVVIILLLILLARPMLTRKSRRLTLIAVIDRSLSIPAQLQQASIDYLSQAVAERVPADRLAVVDVAEAASISKLPSGDITIRRRNTTLTGQQTRLADGVQMAMAIAPPDTAVRILLVSEGNETGGNLREATQTAAANKIPIDVLPLRYRYDKEVIFKRLVAPTKARSGQTISLRFILDSTTDVHGKLLLTLNDKPVDLVPAQPEVAADIELRPGTNVKSVSVQAGTHGMHEFEAVFIPDTPDQDRIADNNRASAMTYVAGPGHILIVDADGSSAQSLQKALQNSGIGVQYSPAADFTDNLAKLMGTDAVILVDTDCSNFTYQQQEMLHRYVKDLGGGLIMVGGPQAFGAGGWIGSPVAEILPVDLDPPQKEHLPKGALVLIIDRSGSMTGQKVEICKYAAMAAVRLLSRRDLVGVVAFDASSVWLVPLDTARDKDDINNKIRGIGAGGGTIMGPAMELAFGALRDVDVAVKHVILLTDGMTSDREFCAKLGADMANSCISVSTVAVGLEADSRLLFDIAQATQGRFYRVTDPMNIPEIFVKEAQVVRRSMIIEQTFSPQVVSGLNELTKGISPPLPLLDGYVLTGPKGGLNRLVLASHYADPILATCQFGLGRCVAFTSSVDSRWASNWLQWGGFARFWEQTVRWAAKPSQSTDCEVFADVQGRQVTINVEALDAEGKFVQFANIEGQIIAPDMSTQPLQLAQAGPGQYHGQFYAAVSGSYVVNLQYRKLADSTKTRVTHTTVTIPFAPEFRDLSDNTPLLAQVSEISGGRILPSDPNQANLFDYTGLKFPETHLPLIRPLMLIWLALFLLDVAVRRVVLDLKAVTRRVFVRSAQARRRTDQTLQRLRATQKKLRDQLSSRAADSISSRRYQAPERYEGKLPTAEAEPQATAPSEAKPPKPETEKPEPQDVSHIQRLLRAKRKAAERGTEDNEQNNQ